MFGASPIPVILLRTANLFFLPNYPQICLKKSPVEHTRRKTAVSFPRLRTREVAN